MKRLAALILLASFAVSEARAGETVGGGCPTGAHVVSDGVILTCVGGAWAATSVQVGNDSATCNSGKAGAIRWSGSALDYCEGTSWTSVTSGGALSGLSDVSLSSPASGHVLQYNGSAWANVAASAAMGTTTMVANLPDAIRCAVSGEPYIFYYVASLSGNTYYRIVANTTGDMTIYYNSSTGAYVGNSSASTQDCVTSAWSISQLYAQGRAFNFIGTGAVTTFDAGTASNPGLAVTSDTNTGLWSSGADTLNLSTGGSERLRVSSTGNVGIGTTSPSERLDIGGGNIAMGYERVTASFATTGSVSCSAGKRVIGGGCVCTNGSGNYVRQSYPSSDTAWACYCDTGSGNGAYAICANMK